ncbi:hypothetical protein HMPREF2533_03777 [Bacteroides fragilis]|uniref:Transmembrane protein n=1 Tax=Bacteroides fragilis (strain ATCC 25285 / DSM 2151 / CCUG 4856 / JCM 11019 / LMG 10263 / NCTC 9343 / Onslow / VPI 2553 / EN-2) TaxID=272559 RepID=Q5LI02_BACFN|nr:hypothetical protein HMPREF2530_03777 [Bacteroides fragilis]KXU42199.1 hypothetical protein HMPREF2533_03777 [Bacteroides fragilis]CAH06228.1 putative transmembrane protein [Bacteroides fragilis NCTC 9343]
MNYIVWLQEIIFDSHRLIFKKIAYWIKVNINFTSIFHKQHKTLLINNIHQITIFTYILCEYHIIILFSSCSSFDEESSKKNLY